MGELCLFPIPCLFSLQENTLKSVSLSSHWQRWSLFIWVSETSSSNSSTCKMYYYYIAASTTTIHVDIGGSRWWWKIKLPRSISPDSFTFSHNTDDEFQKVLCWDPIYWYWQISRHASILYNVDPLQNMIIQPLKQANQHRQTQLEWFKFKTWLLSPSNPTFLVPSLLSSPYFL